MQLIRRRTGECISPGVFKSAFAQTYGNPKDVAKLGPAPLELIYWSLYIII